MSEGEQVDLDQFTSLEQALDLVEYASGGFRSVGLRFLPGADPIARPTLFFSSALSRGQGLHDAVSRELRMSNPHAVYPLIRAYAELAATVIYVTENPHYIAALWDHPKHSGDARRRLSMQGLIAAVAHRMGGLKAVYDELNEATHFGNVAFWASHSLTASEDEDTMHLEWQSAPRWTGEKDALVACAWALELAYATTTAIGEFGQRHLTKEPPR